MLTHQKKIFDMMKKVKEFFFYTCKTWINKMVDDKMIDKKMGREKDDMCCI